jgi:hypothetical protein
MNGTSPRFLKAIPLIILLLTALASPAFSEDIKTLTKRAEGGDAIAQYNLGVEYASGQGVLQDYTEAVKWWRKAAEQGVRVCAVPTVGEPNGPSGSSDGFSAPRKWDGPQTPCKQPLFSG